MQRRSCLLAATLFLSAAAHALVAPLPSPDLAQRTFRNGSDVVAASAVSVIGITPSGTSYVAGPFTSVDGFDRPHGMARLLPDGRLDPEWSPGLLTGTKRSAVESPQGTLAYVYASGGGEGVGYLKFASPLSGGVIGTAGAIHAITFDAQGALYVAHGNPASPVVVDKWAPNGDFDPAFQLTLRDPAVVACPAPRVHTLAAIDGMLYVGGDFTSASNPRGSLSIRGATRVSQATGDIDASWAPVADTFGPPPPPGPCPGVPMGVRQFVDAPQHVYIAGNLHGLSSMYNLARYSKTGGARDTTWDAQAPPTIGGAVLDPTGRYLYVAPDDGSGTSVTAYSTSAGASLSSWALAGQAPSHLRSLQDRLLVGGPGRLAAAPHVWQVGPADDWDADGLPNSVEVAINKDPTLKDNDVFNDTWLFAAQQYRDFLSREGDAAGISFWSEELALGRSTRARMVETFLSSAEFQGFVAPVTRLYFAYFLRIPDYDGLRFWIARLRGGESLEAISGAFAGSPEFGSQYGALDNGQFVDRVYQNVLGRLPDAAGRAHWKGQLDAGAMTRGQLMLAFSESPEYRSLIAAEVSVTMTYMGMLRRAPDAGGFSFWVGYMEQGNSMQGLIAPFLAAPEYRARFLP